MKLRQVLATEELEDDKWKNEDEAKRKAKFVKHGASRAIGLSSSKTKKKRRKKKYEN